MDSTPSRRLRHSSSKPRAPGKRPAMPMMAISMPVLLSDTLSPSCTQFPDWRRCWMSSRRLAPRLRRSLVVAEACSCPRVSSRAMALSVGFSKSATTGRSLPKRRFTSLMTFRPISEFPTELEEVLVQRHALHAQEALPDARELALRLVHAGGSRALRRRRGVRLHGAHQVLEQRGAARHGRSQILGGHHDVRGGLRQHALEDVHALGWCQRMGQHGLPHRVGAVRHVRVVTAWPTSRRCPSPGR